MNLFSDDMRRNPFPVFDQIRAASPVLHVPPFNAWLVFDYEGVRRAVTDHETFSSAVKGPGNWFIFADPPRHTRLRALIAKAFTPRSVTGLEPYIRGLARRLLDQAAGRGVMDLAEDFAGPLPMMVIARLIGIPDDEMPRYRRWSDEILKLSFSLFRGPDEARVVADFRAVTAEMRDYLPGLLEARRADPQDDLLTRLVGAEVDGERLTDEEILGFFQLLLVGGQETTTNLINNAAICFMDHPDQLARVRARPDLLPSAIEEVLRYRSPLQWLMRTPRRDVELHGQVIPAGELVLAVIGSANRDPKRFPAADRFDVAREPNPHIAFGHGLHACLGAPLARLEARVALEEFLGRMKSFEPATDEPWEPRKALNVHGPARLPIRFELNEPVA